MTIIVYCEKDDLTGEELLTKARCIAGRAEIVALDEGCGESLFTYGADQVYRIARYDDDCAQGSYVSDIIKALHPDITLFPATVRGRFLSAWIAARLKTGLTADCTELSITDDGLLRQTRPAYGSSLTADILCRERRPQMASVRPGVFRKNRLSVLNDRSPSDWTGAAPDPLMEKISFDPVNGGHSLKTAKIVVAGGKGVGSKEGFAFLKRLADRLGGALGATRGAVDAGYISYAHQIGQTGITVHPDLYIAFGISGMVQHVVGMNNSGRVIAVNPDKSAPIFRAADYGIIADWRETAEYIMDHY